MPGKRQKQNGVTRLISTPKTNCYEKRCKSVAQTWNRGILPKTCQSFIKIKRNCNTLWEFNTNQLPICQTLIFFTSHLCRYVANVRSFSSDIGTGWGRAILWVPWMSWGLHWSLRVETFWERTGNVEQPPSPSPSVWETHTQKHRKKKLIWTPDQLSPEDFSLQTATGGRLQHP